MLFEVSCPSLTLSVAMPSWFRHIVVVTLWFVRLVSLIFDEVDFLDDWGAVVVGVSLPYFSSLERQIWRSWFWPHLLLHRVGRVLGELSIISAPAFFAHCLWLRKRIAVRVCPIIFRLLQFWFDISQLPGIFSEIMNHFRNHSDQRLHELRDLIILLLFHMRGFQAHEKFDECVYLLIQRSTKILDVGQNLWVTFISQTWSLVWPVVVAQHLWVWAALASFVLHRDQGLSLASSVVAWNCVVLYFEALLWLSWTYVLKTELLSLELVCCQIAWALDYLLSNINHFVSKFE